MRAEFSKIQKNTTIGFTSYGPKVTEINLAKEPKDTGLGFGYCLNKALASLIFTQESEDFKPIKKNKLRELEYICMLKSSLGFGLLALKNTSFNKKYTVEISNKTIGKFFKKIN